jgi:hypothetical protein
MRGGSRLLREQIRASSERLLQDFERTTKALQQNLDKGEAREAALREVLDRWLPKRLSIGRGEVVAANGQASGQLDIVIHDAHSNPPLFQLKDSPGVFPIESVFGVIEVKSNLRNDEFPQILAKLRDVYDLPRQDVTHSFGPLKAQSKIKPFVGVFGFDGPKDIEPLLRTWGGFNSILPVSQRLNIACLLGQGCLMYVPKEQNAWSLGTEEDDLPTFVKAAEESLLLLILGLLTSVAQAPALPVADWFAYAGGEGCIYGVTPPELGLCASANMPPPLPTRAPGGGAAHGVTLNPNLLL